MFSIFPTIIGIKLSTEKIEKPFSNLIQLSFITLFQAHFSPLPSNPHHFPLQSRLTVGGILLFYYQQNASVQGSETI